jgi:hypothetical protein
VFYLNQPGNQPRERDYAYVGSFYAFAIWIGLAVVALVRMAHEAEDKLTFRNTLFYGSVATFLILMMSNTTTTMGGAMLSSLIGTALFAAIVAGATYIVRAASGKGANLRTATITAFLICAIAPALMGFEEWDDHNRSQKTLAPDIARNYLESCAPNAILFTFGDNDTYPLWYAQEVEDVRPDIRIINTSLLGIDWYVNQLRYKVNESAPIDVIWTAQQLQGLSYIQYQPPQGAAQDRYYPLYRVMKEVVGAQSPISTFPTRRFTVPVDPAIIRQYNVVNPTDTLLTEMRIDLPEFRSYLTLDQLTILNIIAANNWKRPIYFTAPYNELGFDQYLRKDGLSYRLVPAKLASPQQNWIIGQSMRAIDAPTNNDVIAKNLAKFQFGGAALRGTYFDEENRRQLLSIRSIFGETAGNLADAGRKQEATQLLAKVEKGISTANMPYAMVGRNNSHNQTGLIYLEAAYKAGNTALAEKVGTALRKDLAEQKKYYDYLRSEREEFYQSVAREDEINTYLIQIQDAIEKHYRAAAQPPIIERPAADSTNR